MNPMKIEIPFLAALVLIGTSLLARIAAQGIEQALLSTAIEYGLNGIKGGIRLSPRLGWHLNRR
jgi:hypothetical protein